MLNSHINQVKIKGARLILTFHSVEVIHYAVLILFKNMIKFYKHFMTVTVFLLIENISINSFCSAPLYTSFPSLHSANKPAPLKKKNENRS